MATLCHVFGVHRSSYKYWKNRPEKPDGRRAVLRSQVLELHGISHGSAGARSIATMATQRGYQMGRWLAGRLMKELGLVSCQQPTYRYKRGGHEHVAIPNYLERQFAVTERFRKTSGKMHFYFNRSSFNHHAGFCCFFIACGRSARLFNTQSAAFSASGVIGLPVRTSTFVPTLAAAAACISSNLSPTI